MNVGNLVVSRHFPNNKIYRIVEVQHSDWAEKDILRVERINESFEKGINVKFWSEDFRLATPEEIAKMIADKMLGKSNMVDSLNGLFKEVYADKLETLIPVPTIFGKHDKS